MAANKNKRRPKGDYPVGYCRPPAEHQFRAGQSGNPTGSRKRNTVKTATDELKEIAATPVVIGDGKKTRKVSLLSANLWAHGVAGAKGDARSAALFLNQAHKLGLYEERDHDDRPIVQTGQVRPSDVVFGGLDLELLSKEQQVELSRLGAMINQAGSIWALNASQLERMRELVGKAGDGRDGGDDKGESSDATRH